MPIETKSKVSLSTFRPRDHGAASYEKTALVLGTFLGVVDTFVTKVTPDKPDEPYDQLIGNFRCIVKRADGTTETIQAGIGYMPDAWQLPIVQMLKEGAQKLKFAYTVKIEKAGNPAGYSWVLTPLIETVAIDDPLSMLAAQVMPVATIEAPKEEQKAPEPAAAKK